MSDILNRDEIDDYDCANCRHGITPLGGTWIGGDVWECRICGGQQVTIDADPDSRWPDPYDVWKDDLQ
jgi:hypothetical protein